MVLLRFAPSPTGPLHLGGLRTALYNHLFARKAGGKWLLRIEDTDSRRFIPGSVQSITAVLAWARLDYDYGPDKGGPHAPYHQSERLDLYRTYTNSLLQNNHAYRCFCSPDALATKRENLARTGSNSTYDKTCLHLTEEEVSRRVRAREKFVVRLNESHSIPRQPITDIVFGQLKDTHASLPTDPILLKSDGFPTYHLASVVDDHHMGITHVVRGEEWLPSLSLHLDLYALLGFDPPEYAHLPLLLNPDGSKMSKRNGDVKVIDYIRRGWEPEALLNWLALAGWGATSSLSPSPSFSSSPSSADSSSSSLSSAHIDSTSLFTLEEMIAAFDLRFLTHRRPLLDPLKLEYINKRHLMRVIAVPSGLDALARRVHETVKDSFPKSQYTELEYLKKAIQVMETRLKVLGDITTAAPYLFVEPDLESDEAREMADSFPSSALYRSIMQSVHSHLSLADAAAWREGTLDLRQALNDRFKSLSSDSTLEVRRCMSMLRHAVSGMKAGPGVPDIMRLLGKDRTLQRLKNGWEWLENARGEKQK